LPTASEFYFAVVSARRTRSETGLRGIATVQVAFSSAGVEPTWYVDAECLEEYRALGLKAVVGGKLTPARNMALRDARAQGKVCVQCSDDISSWEYRHGEMATERTMDALNEAHDAARQFVISPVAAARFMIAKMRGVREETKPKLGGVYCLASCSRTFASAVIARRHFIIGDFFVDDKSDICFDESLTLKEDYDFTCAHLKKYGSVMRFDRMTISARHYSNQGGACSNRDAKGIQERKNVAILMHKWPLAIFHHRTRTNEVNLRWTEHKNAVSFEKKAKSRIPKAKLIASKFRKTKVVGFSAFPPTGLLVRTGKPAASSCINQRCAKVAGATVSAVCSGSFEFTDNAGRRQVYSAKYLSYDVSRAYLVIRTKKA